MTKLSMACAASAQLQSHVRCHTDCNVLYKMCKDIYYIYMYMCIYIYMWCEWLIYIDKCKMAYLSQTCMCMCSDTDTCVCSLSLSLSLSLSRYVYIYIYIYIYVMTHTMLNVTRAYDKTCTDYVVIVDHYVCIYIYIYICTHTGRTHIYGQFSNFMFVFAA